MIDYPQSDETHRRGQRGDTTETYVRHAQERIEHGAAAGEAESAAARGEGARGVRGLLQKLWPFGKRR